MDSVLASVHKSSNTSGENLWRTENCANKYYAISTGFVGVTNVLWGTWLATCISSFAGSYVPKASQHKRKIQKEYNFMKFRQPCLKPLFKSVEGRSTYQECNRKYVVKAASGPSFESDPRTYNPKNIFNSTKNFLNALVTFCSCYPYALLCLVLSTISTSLLAVEKLSDICPLFFTGVLQINKPYLPLASGEVSFTTGVTIVASCSILSFWQGWAIGSWPLIWGLISTFVIWTAYSIHLPLLRWKRFPIMAAMVILATWTFTYPLPFFFHMQTFVFKRPAVFSRPLIFHIVISSFFSIAIALFKDIPDIEGDQAFGIRSFSARLGQKRVFWICISIIEMACGVGLLAGATSFSLWSRIVTGLGHVVLASVALYRARSVDLKSKASIMSFYLFIWKLLYAEHLLMPLLR